MIQELEIRFRHVPSEILAEFQTTPTNRNYTVKIIHDEKMYFSASGGPNDILFFFGTSLTELIVTGVIYDVISYPIKSTWKRAIEYYKTLKFGIRENNQITLNFEISKDNDVQFQLDGNCSSESVDKAVDKIFEYLKQREKLNLDFSKKEFHDPQIIKPRIRIRYNQTTNSWEPVNFEEAKKIFKKFEDEANQNSKD